MPHDHGTAADFGEVSFPITCSPAAQTAFTRGVAMLHSFWYDEAAKVFADAGAKDPSCAMAWWGVAMTQFRPVWAPPTPAEFEKGREAVAKALTLIDGAKAAPARERDYVRAIAAYFNNPTATTPRDRALAYEQAMSALHAAHPNDDEGSIFYALALLGTAQASDKTYANQKKGAALLNAVLPKHPRHPGVAHYLIHSFDSPPLAPLALDAARAYAKIAPASPHARHMPSHIFIRLGLWEDSIGSNLSSASAAKAHADATEPGAISFDELHADDYLVYAWLQRGEDDKARAMVERAVKADKLFAPNFAAGYALAAIPGRYALERRAWAEAAAIQPRQPAAFPWDNIPYAEASAWYARGLGAARSGNLEVAREASTKLAALKATMVAKQDPYWPNQIEIQRLATDAWIARAEKRDADALRLMRESADLEASTEKHPVTPGALLPSRELLGDLLLDLGKADEALREYEASLAVAPKRLNTLHGAARAALQLQQRQKAKQYYTELVSLCDKSVNRPAIVEARAFLASE
jgi:tetratricopeptide (TPR) repeat protein